jgi:hypothetical protein
LAAVLAAPRRGLPGWLVIAAGAVLIGTWGLIGLVIYLVAW